MGLLITALVLALIAGVWWLLQKRRHVAADLAATSIQRSLNSEFHAVSIKYTGRACRAAKDITGRRFLAAAAPHLPLPECDVLECNCRFVHHKDRRTATDRRSPFRGGVHEEEQRVGGERRNED